MMGDGEGSRGEGRRRKEERIGDLANFKGLKNKSEPVQKLGGVRHVLHVCYV